MLLKILRKPFLQICLVMVFSTVTTGLLGQGPAHATKKPPQKISHIDPTPNYWLEEDVRWIITPEERAAFKTLKSDEEREQFIEQFWLRRDPTPDTIANEAEDDHYRRTVYANEQFASAVPGWKTDRGRIYIKYGPPDQIDSHRSGGSYQRPMDEGGGSTTTFPYETWHYRYIEGVGQEVAIEFVDTCMCGDYHMTIDPSQRDALLYVPQHERPQPKSTEKAVVQAYIIAQRPPAVQFKELQEILNVKMQYNDLPYTVHTDFVKITQYTDWVRLTIEVKNDSLAWVSKLGTSKIDLAVMGQVTNMTGRIVSIFEDPISTSVPEDSLPSKKTGSQLYWKALALPPGRYRVDIVLKDRNSGAIGTYSMGLYVPSYLNPAIATSSLILADEMAAPKSVFDNFVIGSTRVRPKVEPSKAQPPIFSREGNLNLWMQVYGLSVDEKNRKPNAVVEYELVNSANNKVEMRQIEASDQLPALGQQVTLKKTFSLAALQPGNYQLNVKLSDQRSGRSTQATAGLTVK